MKAVSLLVGLLAAGCVTDPAYIGEGPTHGAGTGGTGGGATGATGSPLPRNSGSCWIERHGIDHGMSDEVPDERVLVTWDADERLFSVGALNLRYDESGLLVEITAEDQTRKLIEYDEKGIPVAFTYFSQGIERPSLSWDQTNEYDELGQVIAWDRTYRADDAGTERTTFDYVPKYGHVPGPTVIRRELVSPLGTTRIRYDFGYDYNPLLVFFEATQDGMITDRYLPSWFQVGSEFVLVQSQWDDGRLSGGVDGRIDKVDRWPSDDHRHIIFHDVDFTGPEPYPAPLDGGPEVTYVYEVEKCAAIAASPYYLYDTPMWLQSYAKTGGWSF